MTNTVLVLGATGKTGRRLVPQLAARGVRVRTASRRSGAAQVVFSWEDPATHPSILEGIDAVYLVAPDLVVDPTPLTGPFLERAKATGVRRVVVLSSMGVDFPNEGPETGRHKLEQQVMASGLDWTLLRPGGFSQNFSEGFLLPGILQGDVIATATGDGAVAFVDADDIAAVAAAALTEEGHAQATYVITGPEALSFADAAAIISRAVGRTITHHPILPVAFTQILLSAGLSADYAAIVVGNQEAIADGLSAGVTDVVARVGGRAPIPFADYAAQAAAAWARP